MAVGDEAVAKGYALVPDTGADDSARVRYGAREINRTRDYIAQVKTILDTMPWDLSQGGTGATTAAAARTNLGITWGTGDKNNSDGANGDIYFKVVG